MSQWSKTAEDPEEFNLISSLRERLAMQSVYSLYRKKKKVLGYWDFYDWLKWAVGMSLKRRVAPMCVQHHSYILQRFQQHEEINFSLVETTNSHWFKEFYSKTWNSFMRSQCCWTFSVQPVSTTDPLHQRHVSMMYLTSGRITETWTHTHTNINSGKYGHVSTQPLKHYYICWHDCVALRG